MPKYSVNEVLEIIQGLAVEDQLELHARFSAIIKINPLVSNRPYSSQNQSQTFGTINISGDSIVSDFGQKQIVRGDIHSLQDTNQATNDSTIEILNLLANLKQKIENNDSLDLLQKSMAGAQIKVVEIELEKDKPDKGLLSRTISILKQGLEGVQTLAEPVMKVSNLIAKAWGLPLP